MCHNIVLSIYCADILCIKLRILPSNAPGSAFDRPDHARATKVGPLAQLCVGPLAQLWRWTTTRSRGLTSRASFRACAPRYGSIPTVRSERCLPAQRRRRRRRCRRDALLLRSRRRRASLRSPALTIHLLARLPTSLRRRRRPRCPRQRRLRNPRRAGRRPLVRWRGRWAVRRERRLRGRAPVLPRPRAPQAAAAPAAPRQRARR